MSIEEFFNELIKLANQSTSMDQFFLAMRLISNNQVDDVTTEKLMDVIARKFGSDRPSVEVMTVKEFLERASNFGGDFG
jgi:hypothetical protein